MLIFRFHMLLFSKQVLSALNFFIPLVLLSGCATTPAPGSAPLTATERQFLANIDPNASVVTKISEQTIEVFNATLPAEGLQAVFGESRFVDIWKNIELRLNSQFVYLSAANRHCASLGLQPDEGTVANTYAKRFTCHQPKQWAVVKLREIAQGCESVMRTLQKFGSTDTSMSSKHPCSVLPDIRPPVDFCAAYSNLTNLTPTSQLTCPAFLNQVKVIEASIISNPATGQVLGGVKTMDSAIRECTGLGFTPKSEKHADCVLRLTK